MIGEYDRRSGNLLEKLYAPFKAPIFRTNFDTAEMIKYVSNAFLSTKISFFNEIYRICISLGLDPDLVSQTVAEDPRIGIMEFSEANRLTVLACLKIWRLLSDSLEPKA